MTTEQTPELAYSTDEENFSKDFSDVLDELHSNGEGLDLIGMTYWVGEKVQHPASFYFKRAAERTIETAHELAYDENEHAEDFTTDATKEAIAELQAFIAKVSGAGTASAGLPGYAAGGNGERK